jgi:excisionase family DNA binding protein
MIEDEDLWTAEDAAEQVGVKPQTIYVWVSRGYLRPAGTHGRHRLFRLADVFEVEATRKRAHRRKVA